MRWLIERIVVRSRSLSWIDAGAAALFVRRAEQDGVAAGMRIAAHLDPRAENLRIAREGDRLVVGFRRRVDQAERIVRADVERVVNRLADDGARRAAPQPFAGRIEVDDAPVVIDRDDAVGNARQTAAAPENAARRNRRGCARECCRRPSAHRADRSSVHSAYERPPALPCRIAPGRGSVKRLPSDESLQVRRSAVSRTRCRSSVDESSPSASAAPSRKPCPMSQPIRCIACRSAAFSRPSATARAPKLCARLMIVWQMPAFCLSVPLPLTKLCVELEFRERQFAQPREGGKALAEIVDRERDAVDAQLRGDLMHQRDVLDAPRSR